MIYTLNHLHTYRQSLQVTGEQHRRRIMTDAKAKVVASVLGTDFIQILAAPAILPMANLKNRMNSSILFLQSSWGNNPILQIVLDSQCKTASAARNGIIKSVPK